MRLLTAILLSTLALCTNIVSGDVVHSMSMQKNGITKVKDTNKPLVLNHKRAHAKIAKKFNALPVSIIMEKYCAGVPIPHVVQKSAS